MTNALTALGLQVSTRQELIDDFTSRMQTIYGPDINLASDTPDGQLMNIYVQSVLDLQDLLVQIYNTFDPDNAIGNVLDQRVAINGIQRQAGTYTITPITIVTSQSLNLYGLDQTDQQIYTVSDNIGNRWFLEETQLGVTVGTHVYNFRAATPGAQLTIPNTITVPVVIVLGVVSINNPTTYTSLGINEETDAVLKVRRQKSVALSSQGYLKGLLAALENINGVTSAFIYENFSDTTDGDGVPGHSIWVVVAGSGAAADIAQAIYAKRNAGCGMFGSENYTITQVDGTPFTVYWDDVVAQTLFVKFTVTPLDGSTPIDIDALKLGLVEAFIPGVNAEVNINQLATIVQQVNSNVLVTSPGFSTGLLQTLGLSAVAASGTFIIRYNGNSSAAINWDDAVGTIQTKIQAVPGLSAVTVTGSIASQSLAFNFSVAESVLGLLYVVSNSLQDGFAAAITFSYDEGFANVLSPTSKKNQFVLATADIIVTPLSLTPATSTVPTTTNVQFATAGGYEPYTYLVTVDNSGGASVNATTGLYISGSSGGDDTVRVTDAFGNIATAIVTVTI